MKKQNKKSAISKTKKRIGDLLSRMDWMFNTNQMDRSVIYPKETPEPNEFGDSVCAEIFYDEKYQRVEIKVFPNFFTKSPTEQRKMLLHELCHTLTLPAKLESRKLLDGKLITADQIAETNERLTSKIENIIDDLFQGNLKYAKVAYKNYLK